ncbi:MAG TPA: hypothetical protein VIK59_07405 [Verrucomicrobiae bacterium]
MSNQAYRDEGKKIEYLFFNFEHHLTIDAMIGLIAAHGRPRRSPNKKDKIKRGKVEFDINWPDIWEHQIIYRQPSDPKTHSPEEIRALEVADIFSRMIATD